MLLLIDMAGAEPKYYVPNSRNKHLVHNGVLILPYVLLLLAGLNWPIIFIFSLINRFVAKFHVPKVLFIFRCSKIGKEKLRAIIC